MRHMGLLPNTWLHLTPRERAVPLEGVSHQPMLRRGS